MNNLGLDDLRSLVFSQSDEIARLQAENKKIREELADLKKHAGLTERKATKLTCSIGEKDLLSRVETMIYLDVGKDWLKQETEKGLKYRRLGDHANSKVRFLKADLLKWTRRYEV